MLTVIIVLLLVSIAVGFLLDRPRAECRSCGDRATRARAGRHYCTRCASDGDYRLINEIWRKKKDGQ